MPARDEPCLIAFRAVENEKLGIGNYFTIHPDGTHLTQVTHFTDTVISHKVSFSPDGQWVAIGRSGTAGGSDIYIASIDGKQVYPVTQKPDRELTRLGSFTVTSAKRTPANWAEAPSRRRQTEAPGRRAGQGETPSLRFVPVTQS